MMNLDIHLLFLGITYTFIADKVHSGRDPPPPPQTNVTFESFVLACGSDSTVTDVNGRNWNPDSPFLSSSENSVVATAQSQDPTLPSRIPYMTARIFTSESTYTFPVSPRTRHWVRLHFYPSIYGDFNNSQGFFAVTAGNFILVSNFSATITAEALTQAYLVREFSVPPIRSGSLSLTFTPSYSYNASFAFVNGIEIISTPEIFGPARLVGFDEDQITFVAPNTMQTIIRLNVGGQFIPATNGSGLSRTWYDDTPYLFAASTGVTTNAKQYNMKIEYPPGFHQYIAPLGVYDTARSMGANPQLNKNYNLTWLFRVDANFTYLVRFHFCDFQMSKLNQRVFSIIINNMTAEPQADVFGWTNARGVPIYKDYTIYINDQTGDDHLWVALHPNETSQPQFNDAILNGLEVFKINDTNGSLAGPNPVRVFSKFSPNDAEQPGKPFEPSKQSKKFTVVAAVFGSVFGFVFVVGLVAYVVFRRRRTSKGGGGTSSTTITNNWLPVYSSSSVSGKVKTKTNINTTIQSQMLSNIGGGFCRHFSLSEILRATNDFEESLVIGVGGFGKVYKGYIDGGTEVAIKRSNPSSQQGVLEFQTEINLLSKLRHRHLVSLIGACEEDREMILVYDFMANGTLREHLYKNNNPPLPWAKRLDICIGAARGLHYLHTGARNTIIHRDVKSTNILLDEKWVAKVSDFGLSKTGMAIHQTHVSTMVKGSFGYLDPEYYRRQQLTEKSDVYSFGVVLFEALCGRPALDTNLPKDQVSLADWAVLCHSKGVLRTIIDPFIKTEITPECLKHFAEIAVQCLSDQGIIRPSMGSVLWNLEYAKQLQNNPDGPQFVMEQGANDAYAKHETLLSIEEEIQEGKKIKEAGRDDIDSTNLIFSQIMNQQGR